MSITLHDSDPSAAELFTEASDKIHSILPSAEIHHVGSTSVPDLGGKGIIDILVAIPNWQDKDQAVNSFKELGFEHVHKEVNNRIFLSRVGDTKKNDVHIHLTYIGSSEYESLLTFRNYLRNNKEEAKRYAQLKRDWLKHASGDRKVYTSSKNSYIEEVLSRAKSPEIIIEIKDTDFNKSFKPLKETEYETRRAARGILIYENKIALLHVSKLNYHKLPGGGFENNEQAKDAFIREVLEETGCNCEIDNENESLVTLEWRGEWKLFQISYIFSAHVIGKPKDLNLTDEEIENGFHLEWVPLGKINDVMNDDVASDYESNFIIRRDRAILKHYNLV